ncbi:DUF4148 domain-containing protein [Caballeronia sp. LZ035]|uniref:DUF4148 domain-containing protein n=1 Tax=Caballeronia sp. LZ035 TaxID=3038568 RepID=UPI002863D243|nr:DUF4148 domain-containing protein [Caballeronia sp. LZ035]MDR5759597.1 DUF4148 domain-containing protein [Caballeronia sp. LZ035]
MNLSGTRLHITIGALAVALSGCITPAGRYGTGADGRHLSPQQCVDLTAIRNHAPPTRARNDSELAALEEAGYNPSLFFDPYYPDDLHQAQRLVDQWYQAECR